MRRKLYEIAADIIEAQASLAQMSPDSLEQALSTVFVTLQRMKMAKLAGSFSNRQEHPKKPFKKKSLN